MEQWGKAWEAEEKWENGKMGELHCEKCLPASLPFVFFFCVSALKRGCICNYILQQQS